MHRARTSLMIVMLWLVGLLAGSARGIAAAAPGEISLGCGGPTGAYTLQVCPALVKQMEELGVQGVKAYPSDGSLANLHAVVQGERTAGLVQMDVLFHAMQERPEYELLLPLGQITPEALFIVVHKTGRITNWDTLTANYPEGMLAKKFRIAVAGSEQSGSYVTVQTLMRAIPTLAKNVEVKAMNAAPNVLYNYLNTQTFDAIAFVMMPDLENERLSAVLVSDNWKFLDINDPRIKAIQINSQSVYHLLDIPLTQGVWTGITDWFRNRKPSDKTLRAPVTYATLLVDPLKADGRVVNALNKAANDPRLLPDKSPSGIAKRWFDTAISYVR